MSGLQERAGSRVLVTGATGFIGPSVVRALLEVGCDVRAFVRRPSERLREAFPGIDVAQGDLQDEASVVQAVQGCDAVVHLAALVSPTRVEEAAAVDRINRVASEALGRIAREAGCRRFVFVSSIAAMGFFDGPATPHSACAPVSAYGRAKRAAEESLLRMSTPEFQVAVLRPPTVYGPGERYNFLSLARAVHSGLFRPIGRGDNVMPLCTAENVARACSAAAQGRVPPGIHLVADVEPYTMQRIHRALTLALGRAHPRLHLPVALAQAAGLANEIAHRFGVPLVLSRARVRTLTVSQPFDVASLTDAGVALDAPLEQTVAETVAEYRAAGLLP